MKEAIPFLVLLFVALLLNQHALAAPTVFHVSTFGAKGDGTSDDGPAIRKAVAAAIKAGPGSKVVFAKKRYRLARTKQNYHISLNGVTGLTIEGKGRILKELQPLVESVSNNPLQRSVLISRFCDRLELDVQQVEEGFKATVSTDPMQSPAESS